MVCNTDLIELPLSMLCRTLTLVCIFIAAISFAQNVKTDTVKRGCYIPLDSNVMSCKIGITPAGKKLQLTTISGNKIPDSTISVIGHLEPGSEVVYSELTVFNNGILQKASGVRYVIGNKNTRSVKRDVTYPDTLAAKEIAAIVLDKHVYSFSVSWIINGAMYNYDFTGNGVFGDAKTAIEALPPGTKVWFENIRSREDNGTSIIRPTEIHVVR